MPEKLPASIAAFGLSVLLAACQSTGVDESKATVDSLRQVREALSTAEKKIDNVVQSLNTLSKAEGDLSGYWRNYETAVRAVEADSERVAGLREKARASRVEYLEGWQKRSMSIQDADLRKRSEERRDASVRELDELSTEADEARESYSKWMATVNDVRTYLESDLNAAGVASVADKVERITREADSLKGELRSVMAELDQVIEAMAAEAPSK